MSEPVTIRDPQIIGGTVIPLEAAGRRITPSYGVLLTLAVTKTAATVVGTTTSGQILPADSARLGAVIVNTDPTATLYLAFNGATATTSSPFQVAPNGSLYANEAQMAGQINGIWDVGVTGGASVMAYTA